jgi:hypothetical protein
MGELSGGGRLERKFLSLSFTHPSLYYHGSRRYKYDSIKIKTGTEARSDRSVASRKKSLWTPS